MERSEEMRDAVTDSNTPTDNKHRTPSRSPMSPGRAMRPASAFMATEQARSYRYLPARHDVQRRHRNEEDPSSKEFKIDKSYRLTKIIGHGAYGVVGAFLNEQTGEKVAIKKIQKIFTNLLLAKRTIRELKILRHLGAHPNIISIKNIILPEHSKFEEIYVVQNLMEADMHQIIQSGQELTEAHHQCFLYQILKALKYIHSCNIIHRDLKPGNLLVNSNCEIRICDFGLSRGVTTQKKDPTHGVMSEYVATRWYRAPEVMLSHACYNQAMDVWSVGCIFAELLGGRVLFPGKQPFDQMNLILSVLGAPSEDVISRVPSKRNQEYLRSQSGIPKIPFSVLFPKASTLALDLLSRMLTFDPHQRITVDEALRHPYLAPLFRQRDIIMGKPFVDDAFEHAESPQEIREHIWQEIRIYHKDVAPALQPAINLQVPSFSTEKLSATIRSAAPDPPTPTSSHLKVH